jgi:hypothetical protein
MITDQENTACGPNGCLPRARLARKLTGLIAVMTACRGRIVHVVADSGYVCSDLRSLPRGDLDWAAALEGEHR